MQLSSFEHPPHINPPPFREYYTKSMDRSRRERESERALLLSDQLCRTLLRPPANPLIAILNIRQPKHKRKALLNTELAVLETIISAVAIIPGPVLRSFHRLQNPPPFFRCFPLSFHERSKGRGRKREREREMYMCVQYPKRKLNKFASVVGKSCRSEEIT